MKEIFFTNGSYAVKDLLPAAIRKLTDKNSSEKPCLNLYKQTALSMRKGELIVLASRPSIGKTTLALNWVYDFASKQNKHVGFITSGIPDSETLILRLLALESKINPAKLRVGLLNGNDINKIKNATKKLSNLSIFLSDIPNAKFKDIETAANEMVNKNKIDILFIDGFDYLYEITVSKNFCNDAIWAEQMDSYYDEIYFMMENIKTLANKIQIPIVLLIPIKRDPSGNEPTIKSFEDKLIIPKIADKVIILHRARYKHSDKWTPAKLIMLKHLDNWDLGNNVELEFNNMTCEFRYKDSKGN